MKQKIYAAGLALALLLCSTAGVQAVEQGSGQAGAPVVLAPEASGTRTVKTQKAVIDYSNVEDGYVMVNFSAQSDRQLRAKVISPTTEVTYHLSPQKWAAFPLTGGSGEYAVKVYEQNPATGKYALAVSASFSVTLTNEFAPYLRPNQYVDYTGAVNTLEKGRELAAGAGGTLEKVEKVYDFVVSHLSYDKALARSVQSGYTPVLDDVLAKGKGICFDYAALMTAMLRSQSIPCKLVTGYVGTDQPAYHAWISVWTEEAGWVDGVIYFDGSAWKRMDPTFASTGGGSKNMAEFIGDGKNYQVKYFY